MRVYAVVASDYEDNGTLAIFADRENAQRFADQESERSGQFYSVDEFTVLADDPQRLTLAWAEWRWFDGAKTDGVYEFWDFNSPLPPDGSPKIIESSARRVMVWSSTPESARAARDAEMARLGVV